MAAARPVASLRPALLARKGGARPAMRSAQAQDLTANDLDNFAESQNALGWNDLGEDAPAPTEAKVHRAAFTLRLDAQRHFRLRLASTLRDCSAQVLVTEALDQFLGTIPQLGDILQPSARASKARRPSDHS
jgi:hypothetical protein